MSCGRGGQGLLGSEERGVWRYSCRMRGLEHGNVGALRNNATIIISVADIISVYAETDYNLVVYRAARITKQFQLQLQ